jgi:predicted ATPase/class 3 adenylate cyclase
MLCPNCGSENRVGAKFCNECATPLPLRCSACGAENRAGAKFCDECAAPLLRPPALPQALDPRPINYTPQHLAERIRAEQQAMEARGASDGERKTITALFADLKGSTALIEGLDPEEARAIIDPALQLMMDAVHRYEGYVAQALGDGIFALFGAPIAHEDHPQRALYAALRMQEEMRRYGDQVRLKHGVPLAMRVGVNTGEVVVRSIRKDDLHTDYVPVGHSTNLAARMEQMATPGSILITEYTRKLVEGYFELKALGAAEIKGVEEPLNVYEVLGAGPLRTKLQVAVRRGLTRFVGRQTELDQLQYALGQAKAGHGQIVGVLGEPGLGKSRLFYEFKLTSQAGCVVLEAFSVSYGKASPYLPIIELLKSYFRIEPPDDERTRREKVTGKILTLDRSLEDTLPYLFALLGIEEQPSPLQQMDPQIRRRRTFEALKKLFLRESLTQPLILVFEDLHWIDSETQGLLDTLSEGVASAKILILVNYRPEYRHEWGSKTYYTQLRLAPLGKAEAEALLTFLLGTEDTLTALKALILERTEGTPFFIEEVVQTLVEEGTLSGDRGHYRLEQTPTELHISPTVQGVLAARIDRLAPGEKELLQQLSVIGRQFPLSLVKQVVAQPDAELYRVLSSLQAKEFLYEQPTFPESEYLFKHALTQEVAYGTVLQEQRKTLHERTAQAMEELHKGHLEEHSLELVHHYQRSGNTEKAVEYLGLAGQQAVQRSADDEALRYFTEGIALLTTLPDTAERAQREVVLQILLGAAFTKTRGYGSQEAEQTYLRAQQLCRQLGETSRLLPVLWGLWAFYLVRAKYEKARGLAEQLVATAQGLQVPEFQTEAHYALGFTLFWLGEFESAHTHLEQSIALHNREQHSLYVAHYGADPGVWARTNEALVLWCLGYPDSALQKSVAAVRLARDMGHAFSLAWALVGAAWLHQYRGEEELAREQAEAGITLSTRHGFPYWLALGKIQLAWTMTRQDQGREGIAQIQQGLSVLEATGTNLARTYFLGLIAEAYGKEGQEEKGLAILARARTVMNDEGEGHYGVELYRLNGALLLKAEQRAQQIEASEYTVEAEACFLKAIEIARQQQAKSLELRAVMSLARLWQRQGKKAEARDLLAPVYQWFTEGFDTKDLQEAKALLEELS